MLDSTLEMMRIPLKIDFSTGDVITPREILYFFKLLFEDRTIFILAYNLETVLAEKIETLLSRGTANTRMQDFYDIYALEHTQSENIDRDVFREAFFNTSEKRGTSAVIGDMDLVLDELENSPDMQKLWENYQHKFDYAAEISWSDVLKTIKQLCGVLK
ncbi:MAG: nucleotidyl transferase AbiEii/AbiGii toxin family protein [Oscillospiraceae bacterium]|nr:nucleotidyl transferase AbiEii/AbiGii toxin family protein [Oscillospiraceae bacterium]